MRNVIMDVAGAMLGGFMVALVILCFICDNPAEIIFLLTGCGL